MSSDNRMQKGNKAIDLANKELISSTGLLHRGHIVSNCSKCKTELICVEEGIKHSYEGPRQILVCPACNPFLRRISYENVVDISILKENPELTLIVEGSIKIHGLRELF
ncbi:MAG: hypothetical protein ACFFB3_07630 [Candidatus Hodarchaeota archaeon]